MNNDIAWLIVFGIIGAILFTTIFGFGWALVLLFIVVLGGTNYALWGYRYEKKYRSNKDDK